LEECEHRSEPLQHQGLSDASAEACTNACTDSSESTHSTPVDNDFGEAVRAVMALPLTEAEKAEAVRRLLNAKGAT
jgi:hypothetical protein